MDICKELLCNYKMWHSLFCPNKKIKLKSRDRLFVDNREQSKSLQRLHLQPAFKKKMLGCLGPPKE